MSSTEEFLNNVLLRPGPTQLPYPEDAKWTIRQHVMDLTKVGVDLGVLGCRESQCLYIPSSASTLVVAHVHITTTRSLTTYE